MTIELPAGSHVHGTLGLGDVHCDGRLGDCRIKTGLGRIRRRLGRHAQPQEPAPATSPWTVPRAAPRSRPARATCACASSTGGAVIKNSNGDTWVGVAGGDVRLSAANGSIAVDLAQASVGAKSANGDVRLGEVVRGSVVLETKLGDLEVGIREGTAALLDVSSPIRSRAQRPGCRRRPRTFGRDRRGARSHLDRRDRDPASLTARSWRPGYSVLLCTSSKYH